MSSEERGGHNSLAQSIAQIPTDAQENDVSLAVPPFQDCAFFTIVFLSINLPPVPVRVGFSKACISFR